MLNSRRDKKLIAHSVVFVLLSLSHGPRSLREGSWNDAGVHSIEIAYCGACYLIAKQRACQYCMVVLFQMRSLWLQAVLETDEWDDTKMKERSQRRMLKTAFFSYF